MGDNDLFEAAKIALFHQGNLGRPVMRKLDCVWGLREHHRR